MKNLTRQNPRQLIVAQELINKVKSKCCGIKDLMEIVGCEYLFLFAADLSEDADLVNYYVDNLEFIDASEHSAATPMYDFACRFLCQETSTLQERRTSFFEHFNPDEEV